MRILVLAMVALFVLGTAATATELLLNPNMESWAGLPQTATRTISSGFAPWSSIRWSTVSMMMLWPTSFPFSIQK